MPYIPFSKLHQDNRIYVAVPKETDISGKPYLKNCIFFFNDEKAMDVFNNINTSAKVILTKDIPSGSDVVICDKDVYIVFVLPVLVGQRIYSIYTYTEKDILGNHEDINLKFLPYKIAYEIAWQSKEAANAVLNSITPPREETSELRYNDSVAMIPPSGKLIISDFTLQRMSLNFIRSGVKTCLLYTGTRLPEFEDYFSESRYFKDEDELLHAAYTDSFRGVIHRAWMHGYLFGALVVKHFRNTSVYIKDWNFAESPEDYAFVCSEKDISDYDGMEYIHKNALSVISHYDENEAVLFSEEFQTDIDKYVFLPEPADENVFITNDTSLSKGDIIKIAIAGGLYPSTLPDDFFPMKGMLNAAKIHRNSNLQISFILPEHLYDFIMAPGKKNSYMDFLYESYKYNRLKFVKGQDMGPGVLRGQHFGVFVFEDYCANARIVKHAFPSKFTFYLEAGIPMLVNRTMKSLADLVEKEGLGLAFSNDEVNNLIDIIRQNTEMYETYKQNIISFRQRLLGRQQQTIRKLIDTFNTEPHDVR